MAGLTKSGVVYDARGLVEPDPEPPMTAQIDGDRAVIGAYGYPDSAGHGYIYEATAGGWVESVQLVSSNAINGYTGIPAVDRMRVSAKMVRHLNAI